MRNLIVCCDGTWQTADETHDGVHTPSNVVRFHNALAATDANGNPQLKYYHPGVGTEGAWWQKTLGGSVGAGLGKNIMSAYGWLAANYVDGDRICLLGFSRGAYTVRSLGGMIGRAGLLKLAGLPDNKLWECTKDAYEKGYRGQQKPAKWAAGLSFNTVDPKTGKVPIYFIGVWDTVGALGIPDDLSVLNFLLDRKEYLFHDDKLGDNVEHARQALAIDEMRASFTPTLWTDVAKDRDVKQVWFPGVHCDVGGGYVQTGLSDGALDWMIGEARVLKLAFNDAMTSQVAPRYQDVLHNSIDGFFKLLRSQPRPVPRIDTDANIHKSAQERLATPPISQHPYRRSISLAPGESATVDVFARNPWNDTGLFLESGGQYEFSATGEWLDSSIPAGPGGTADGNFHAGELVHIAGTMWGKIEGIFQNLTRNHAADFKGTRRHEDAPWFMLIGAVANAGTPGQDGTPPQHETIAIGAKKRYTVKGPSGYLYCYANDAWGFYDNNRGSVSLTVRRR